MSAIAAPATATAQVAPTLEKVTDDSILSEASEAEDSDLSETEADGDVSMAAFEADDLVEIDENNVLAPGARRSTRPTTFSDAGLPAEEEDNDDDDFVAPADDE